MTGGGPIFVSEPWGFLLREKQGAGGAGDAAVDGAGSPRAVTAADRELRWSGSAGAAPAAGFSFLWRGQVLRSWHLPAGHKPGLGEEDMHQNWRLSGGATEGILVQQRVLSRPPEGDVHINAAGAKQDAFIDWLVHVFQELGQDQLAAEDAQAAGLVRRTWASVERIWLEPDPNEPRIELIIRMAQDSALLRTLESISDNPRRILLRVREQTPISRIREMDSACIRRYARLPGRDPVEKAGTRQMLLAVQRRASHDTLENRVACWTLEALRTRAERWRQLHGLGSKGSVRAKAVASLAKHVTRYRSGENLGEVRTSALQHPVAANYPLMMEPRYRRVYRTYRDLLKYDRIIDDAWTWRRVLWAEATSQLISCSLRRTEQAMFESSPYFRTEPDRGRWIAAHSSSGPFQTANGIMHVVDPHDFENAGALLRRDPKAKATMPPVLERAGALGCDLLLWWPRSGRIVPVWAVLWTGSAEEWRAGLRRAAEAVDYFAGRLIADRITGQKIRGLVVATTVSGAAGAIETATSGSSTVVGVAFPLEIGTQPEALRRTAVTDLDSAMKLATTFDR